MPEPKPINPNDLRAFIAAVRDYLLNVEDRLEALEQAAGLAPELPKPLPTVEADGS